MKIINNIKTMIFICLATINCSKTDPNFSKVMSATKTSIITLNCADRKYTLNITFPRAKRTLQFIVDTSDPNVELLEYLYDKQWYEWYNFGKLEYIFDCGMVTGVFFALFDAEPGKILGGAGASLFVDESGMEHANTIGSVPIPMSIQNGWMIEDLLSLYRWSSYSGKHNNELSLSLLSYPQKIRFLIDMSSPLNKEQVVKEFSGHASDIVVKEQMNQQFFKQHLSEKDLAILAKTLSLPIDFFQQDYTEDSARKDASKKLLQALKNLINEPVLQALLGEYVTEDYFRYRNILRHAQWARIDDDAKKALVEYQIEQDQAIAALLRQY